METKSTISLSVKACFVGSVIWMDVLSSLKKMPCRKAPPINFLVEVNKKAFFGQLYPIYMNQK